MNLLSRVRIKNCSIFKLDFGQTTFFIYFTLSTPYNFLHCSLPNQLQPTNLSFFICWNFDLKCVANIHTLLHHLLEDAMLLSILLPPCYVEGLFFLVITSMFFNPLELSTLAHATSNMVTTTKIPWWCVVD